MAPPNSPNVTMLRSYRLVKLRGEVHFCLQVGGQLLHLARSTQVRFVLECRDPAPRSSNESFARVAQGLSKESRFERRPFLGDTDLTGRLE